MKATASAVLFLLLSATLAAADAPPPKQDDSIKSVGERIAKLSASRVGDNSRSGIAEAQATLGAAKAAMAASNPVLAAQKTELASVQLDLAEARSAEAESSEQVILRRAEIKNLEARFDQLLQTGGK